MQVCLFDIDGTLIASGGAGKLAMHTALGTAFGVTEPTDGVPMSGRTDRAIARDLFRLHGLEDSPRTWQTFLAAYLEHLPRCLAERPGRVLPGVAELLVRLAGSEGVLLGLLTGNVQGGAAAKLGHYQLWHHFALGAYGDEHHDRGEVALSARRAVASRLGPTAPGDQIWVIGDTPLDRRCARTIDARCVLVATGEYSIRELAGERPDLLVEDFADHRPLLEKLGL